MLIIGKGRAADMILAGEMLTIKKAEEMVGLVKGKLPSKECMGTNAYHNKKKALDEKPPFKRFAYSVTLDF